MPSLSHDPSIILPHMPCKYFGIFLLCETNILKTSAGCTWHALENKKNCLMTNENWSYKI